MSLKFDSSICRVCLEAEGQINLFHPNINIENFRFITLLEAYENDGLPQSLCIKCHVRLKVAHQFKTQAISSQSQLKSYLKEINTSFSRLKGNCKPFEELDFEIEKVNEILPENEQILVEEAEDDIMNNDAMEQETNVFEDLDHLDYSHENEQTHNVENDIEFQIVFEDHNTKKTQLQSKKIAKTRNEHSTNTTVPEKSNLKDPGGLRKVNDLFLCNICENTFTTELNLNRHMEMHLSKRESYDCNICGKLFTQRASVRQHLLIHSGERPFACDECPKTFRRRKTLMGHKQSHLKEKPFQCEFCAAKFTIERAMQIHIRRDHGDGNDVIVYPCKHCQKVYRSKYSLNDHILNQHSSKSNSKNVQQYQCKESDCKRVFTSRYKYNSHMKNHSNPIEKNMIDDGKTYKVHHCDVCPAFFKTKRSLTTHMEIHETNENFPCSVCEMAFGRKYKLLLHMQEHEKDGKESSFACRKCNKQFNILDNLYEHLKDHIAKETELFKCFHCIEYCISRSSLKAHIVNVHKDKFNEWNVCSKCDLTFLTFDTYYDHMLQIHNSQETDTMETDCKECGEEFENVPDLNQHIMEHDVVVMEH